MKVSLRHGHSPAPFSILSRKTILFAFFALTAQFLSAQKDKNGNPGLPEFGKVEKADLEMKTCDFDDKAEAMILIDEGALELGYGELELKRRIRIKILNNKGLEWANVHLPYQMAAGNQQQISKIEAQTYNLDASGNIVVTKLDKKLVYEKKINKRLYEKVFTFPEARVGSIIEYKYSHYNIGLIDWYFQKSVPVRFSKFVVDFPQEIEVAVTPYCNREFSRKVENPGLRTVTTYSMEKVPALRDEPFVINEDYYRDRLITKIVAYPRNGIRSNRTVNWMQVIKFLMEDEDFGVQIKKDIPRTADLDEKLKTVVSPYLRMKTVYNYVQANMQWNELSGIWAMDGVKSAWKDKKGTAGEINLILVNLLKDAGLNAHPILVSTHENGVVNTFDAGTYESPGFYQFDKVMAYVTLDSTAYVLDATQKNTPVHLLPANVLNTQGLVIEKLETYQWGWKTLWRDNATARNVIMLSGDIDASGKMKGVATISSFDYARLARIEEAKKERKNTSPGSYPTPMQGCR